MITLADRAANYSRIFPDWPPPRYDNRWLDDVWADDTPPDFLSTVWVLGNDYQGTGFYGAYPPNYLKRVMSLFPEINDESHVLHLFSGMLFTTTGIKLDCKIHSSVKVFQPDILANAEELPFRSDSFDLILADPPYGGRDAEKYKVRMPNKRKVFEECHRILRMGANLVWLDTSHPMYSKMDWHLWGLIGVVRSTNHVYRFASIFSKQ